MALHALARQRERARHREKQTGAHSCPLLLLVGTCSRDTHARAYVQAPATAPPRCRARRRAPRRLGSGGAGSPVEGAPPPPQPPPPPPPRASAPSAWLGGWGRRQGHRGPSGGDCAHGFGGSGGGLGGRWLPRNTAVAGHGARGAQFPFCSPVQIVQLYNMLTLGGALLASPRVGQARLNPHNRKRQAVAQRGRGTTASRGATTPAWCPAACVWPWACRRGRPRTRTPRLGMGRT